MTPCFNNTTACYVFSTDNNYAPYLGIALFSLRENACADEAYDICILHTDLSLENQTKLQSLAHNNFSIRFVDISNFLTEINTDIFATHAHFSKEAYYRFFIPQIFLHYDKVIYFDCDMIFLENMNELLNIDMHNMPLAAVLEYKFKCKVEYDPILSNYAHDILQLKNVQNFFNSGFLLFDIKKLRALNFTAKCIERLKQVLRPRTVDQCIINSVMQDKVFFIDPSWNLQTHVDIHELKKFVPAKDYEDYKRCFLRPKVIHFCSPTKPWNSKDVLYGKIWWQYAEKAQAL